MRVEFNLELMGANAACHADVELGAEVSLVSGLQVFPEGASAPWCGATLRFLKSTERRAAEAAAIATARKQAEPPQPELECENPNDPACACRACASFPD